MEWSSEERLVSDLPWKELSIVGPLLIADGVLSRALERPGETKRLLTKFLRSHPVLDSSQRRLAAEAVFGCVVWQRRLKFHCGSDDVARMLAALAGTLGKYEEAWEVLHVPKGSRPIVAGISWMVRFSCPDWIAEKFEARFGVDGAERLGDAINVPGPVCLRVNGPREVVREQLRTIANIATDPGAWADCCLIVKSPPHPNIDGLPESLKSLFEVQDEGSQLLGKLLERAVPSFGDGDEILDLCAGAGGKSIQLAMRVGARGRVHCADIDLARLHSLKVRAMRAGVSERIVIHGESPPPSLVVPFALVDAPCSELGVLRRDPGARFSITPQVVLDMAQLQLQLLERAWSHLSQGGCVAYATCSLSFEENELVVTKFLARHKESSELLPLDFDARLLDATEPRYLLLAPHIHGTDGFFGCVIRKK